MRFSVDAHAVGQHLTGNEVYVRNLLKEYAALDDESEFVAYVSADTAASALADGVPDRFHKRTVSRNPFIRLGFDLPRKLREDRPDLIHVQYTAPLWCPCPIVATVHDVSFLEHPEYFTRFRYHQLCHTVRRTVRAAARILTVSEFSRKTIEKAYGLDGHNIIVVPNAASNTFHPMPREAAVSWIRARFNLPPGPFVLTVGDLQPRKNHAGLICAFEALIRAHPSLPHRLLMVGKDAFFAPAVHRAAQDSGVADRLHFTGFVTDDELLHLYASCELFVFPSFYEGFGLPILEAMACGRAVACANTTAIPEVANAAAILFDPHSIREMTRAMEDLILDAELRSRMERLGLHRSTLFSWERTARQTLAVYYEVAGGPRDAPAKLKSIAVGER